MLRVATPHRIAALLLTLLALCRGWDAGSAHAQARVLQLEVDASQASGCSDSASLLRSAQRRVEVRPDYAANSGAVDALHLTISQLPNARSFRVRLSARDAQSRELGVRELDLDAPSCADLDPALVLMIAAAVGVKSPPPDGPRKRIGEHPAPTEPDDASAHVLVDSSAPTIVRDRSADPWDWELALGPAARGVTHVTPDAALGAAVELLARHGPLQAVATFLWLPSTSFSLGADTSHFRLLLGQLDLCASAVRVQAVRLSLCAGAQAGELRAHTHGLTTGGSEGHFLLQVGPAARMHWNAMPWLTFVAALGASIPVVAPHFWLRTEQAERTSLHRVEIGFWLQLGGLVRFGT